MSANTILTQETPPLHKRLLARLQRDGGSQIIRHKGGIVGVAPWPDAWAVVQVEGNPAGPPTVEQYHVIPVEGDGTAHLQAILRQKAAGKCVGVLTPGQYRTFLEESVNAPVEELVAIMRFRVRDRLEFPLENAAIAVQPLPARKRDDGVEKPMVNVFATNQEEVLRLCALAARVRMQLVGVDAHESALRHIASHCAEASDNETILLHIGVQDAQVMAIRDRETVFSRRIKIGTERIHEVLRLATGDRGKNLAIAVEPLALELQRTLDYIRTRLHMAVGRVRLAPLEHPVAGLAATLGTLLPGVVVLPLPLTEMFHFTTGEPDERELALLLPALGAALGRLRNSGMMVNLLEERFRPKQDPLSGKSILGMGVVSLLLLGATLGVLQAHMGKVRAGFATVSSQEATLKAEVLQQVDASANAALNLKLENQMQQLAEKIARNERLLDYLNNNQLGQKEGFAGYLEDLSRQAVAGVWLTGVTLRNGGQEIGFAGRGESVGLVPRFIEAIGQGSHFRDRRFDILHIAREKSEKNDGNDKPTSKTKSDKEAKDDTKSDQEEIITFSLRTKRIPEMKHE
ncbi:MAG: hypothetical protein HQL66_00045 [Magnetococcales bacterium]|nr:hypothetical protein [Magnetococcales bacterium]